MPKTYPDLLSVTEHLSTLRKEHVQNSILVELDAIQDLVPADVARRIEGLKKDLTNLVGNLDSLEESLYDLIGKPE